MNAPPFDNDHPQLRIIRMPDDPEEDKEEEEMGRPTGNSGSKPQGAGGTRPNGTGPTQAGGGSTRPGGSK